MSESTAARLQALQAELVDELRAEYYCEDLPVPAGAFGWAEERLRTYFESAGESEGDSVGQASSAVASASIASAEQQRPVLVALGDRCPRQRREQVLGLRPEVLGQVL